MTESESELQEVVLIVESPNPRDILDGRAEGEALSAALKLAEIPNYYYRACNRATFRTVFLEKFPLHARSEIKVAPHSIVVTESIA